MVIIAIVSAGLLAVGVSIQQLFLIVALLGIGVSFYICSLLPDAFVRSVYDTCNVVGRQFLLLSEFSDSLCFVFILGRAFS